MAAVEQIEKLTVAEYKSAFKALRDQMSDSDLRMLKGHYDASNYIITATQLSQVVGFKNFNAANLRYGKLAGRLCEFFEIYPKYNVLVLATFKQVDVELHWIMRPQVVQAIHELGWFRREEPATVFEEIEQFKKAHKTLKSTTRNAIVQSRIGQGQFRADLIEYWGACAVSGCTRIEILKASHIKPWRFSSNTERLDVFNGLLLLPNLDTCFDLGLISFCDDGAILLSSELRSVDLSLLGIRDDMRLTKVEEMHLKYLCFHRENIFRK